MRVSNIKGIMTYVCQWANESFAFYKIKELSETWLNIINMINKRRKHLSDLVLQKGSFQIYMHFRYYQQQ